MRIRCEITAVETHGDKLAVRLQGDQARSAEWRPKLVQHIEINDSEASRKAFHVGRIVTLTVKPYPPLPAADCVYRLRCLS